MPISVFCNTSAEHLIYSGKARGTALLQLWAISIVPKKARMLGMVNVGHFYMCGIYIPSYSIQPP